MLINAYMKEMLTCSAEFSKHIQNIFSIEFISLRPSVELVDAWDHPIVPADEDAEVLVRQPQLAWRCRRRRLGAGLNVAATPAASRAPAGSAPPPPGNVAATPAAWSSSTFLASENVSSSLRLEIVSKIIVPIAI
jgi:hypothetical protein